VPGPQDAGGPRSGLRRAEGFYSGVVTGMASRSQYIWGGASYQRYAESGGDRRPDLLFYSLVYGYRPQSWRTDYPRWDWRLFGELTGERGGSLQAGGIELARSQTHQVFLGPSLLGVYKQYGVSVGIQAPLYRAVSPIYGKERFRFTVNLAYFF
jgi:hypothetical protein